jgi:DNA-binding NtrC family response regulator
VRELVNIIERLLVLNGGDEMDETAIRRCLPELSLPGQMSMATGEKVQEAGVGAASPAPSIRFGDALSLEELERRHILATLERVGGNKQEAADRLGIARRTLWDRLVRYKGEVPDTEAQEQQP